MESSAPKTVFTRILKELTNELNKENLRSEFKKCGIYPLDCNQVLNHLPNEDNPQEENLQIDKCLINILSQPVERMRLLLKKKKKISFAPGKDISFN